MQPYHILAASPEQTTRDMLDLILGSDGHQVTCFGSGGELLTELRRAVPDGLILDDALDGPSALELCRRIRKVGRLKQVPIILLASPGRDQTLLASARQAQANEVLGRPLIGKNVRARIRRIIEESRVS